MPDPPTPHRSGRRLNSGTVSMTTAVIRSQVIRLALISLLIAASALCASPLASASIWTPVNSGTTDDITALAYTGPAQLVFVTSSGKAFHRTPSGFAQGGGIAAGAVFTDVAFAPNGINGVAVGNSGVIYHTADGGANWTRVDPGSFPTIGGCSRVGSVSIVPVTNYNLESVQFATPTTAYATGTGGIILKSTTSGAAFAEVNHRADGSCKAGSIFTQGFGDSQWIDGQTGYVFDDWFGTVYAVTDGLATNTAAQRAGAVNDFSNRVQVALDKVNDRMWSVSRGDGYAANASIDGGQSWSFLYKFDELGRASACCQRLADVAVAGGTVVAVGDSGVIYTSIDGQHLYLQRAADFGPNVTEGWAAVDLYDASHAAVGGAGGQLAMTNVDNTVPDFTKPTGVIVGPTSGLAGQPLTFSANVADEPGGSGVDPAGFAWTANGLPAAHGPSATFTFPTAGYYTLQLSFSDLAGNTSVATKTVSISAPSTTRTMAAPPTFAFTGAGTQLTARRAGRRIQVTVKGRVIPPAGVNGARACTGSLVLHIASGHKLLASRTAAIRPSCRFSTTIVLSRRTVGRANMLGLTVLFRGNRVMGPRTTTFTIKLTR